MADFDFSALEVKETTVPLPKGGRGTKFENNPLTKHVEASWTTKTGRQISVPKSQMKDAVYLLRRAAEALEVGLRVVTVPTGEVLAKATDNKTVVIKFQAQKRKQTKKNRPQPAPAVETTPTPATAPDAAPTTSDAAPDAAKAPESTPDAKTPAKSE